MVRWTSRKAILQIRQSSRKNLETQFDRWECREILTILSRSWTRPQLGRPVVDLELGEGEMEDQVARWRLETNPHSHKNLKVPNSA